MRQLTIDGQVPERRTGRSLYFRVVTRQQVQNWVERVSSYFPHVLLRDLGKGERSGPLEVDIVGEREGGKGGEGRAGEEIGGVSVWRSAHVTKSTCRDRWASPRPPSDSLSRYCKRSATASRSFSSSNGSYAFFRLAPPERQLGKSREYCN